MEPFTLKPRQSIKNEIESWDDDEDLQGIDELQFRNFSSNTVGTNSSAPASQRRESLSSRRSDMEDDEDWQVLLAHDDEGATSNAIASAKNAGIPLPNNVPASALIGGTIKRLGGKRVKRVIGDDWGDDLELPASGTGGLKLKQNTGDVFPDSMRHISVGFPNSPSPVEPQTNMSFLERLQSAGKSSGAMSTLEKFRDDELDDDFGDVPTIKIAKNRPGQKFPNFLPLQTNLAKPVIDMDNFEDDLEFPTDGEPLKLSARKEMPKTPAQFQDEFDNEWAEGSQGSFSNSFGGNSFGGPQRAGRSNRSSSISALSPSVFSPSLSSCLTAESEDEGLDGLILPDGPLKFEEALKRRLESASPDPTDGKKPENRVAAKEDFFADIEIGDGDVFDSGKLTLNRNIKHTTAKATSPTRRIATTLTFTNKPSAITTRIPKPSGHDRTRSKLEPVSESGGPVPNYNRTTSRLGGHSSQSSVSSIPTPSTPLFPPIQCPSTPSRRGLVSRSSRDTLRTDTTTTSAQLLKAKRSMPAMKTHASPSRTQPQPTYQRPLSRNEKIRSILPRPKTPVDRSGAESSLSSVRKPPIPFLPAGNVYAQSHHISSKTSRNFHRTNSSDENIPLNRSISRLSNPHYRPHTPTRSRDLAPESLVREAASKRTITKPTRRRVYGDGYELDVFDDLPTSATAESKFTKQPIGRGPVKTSALRSKLNSQQNPSLTSLGRTETPVTPASPKKFESNVPSFARDTAASRLAREQRVAALHPPPVRTPLAVPLAPISTNWKARVAAKPAPSLRRTGKSISTLSHKPQLIKPLGNTAAEPKSINEMKWDPASCRWDGNEQSLAPFDVPLPTTPSNLSLGGLSNNPKPALIANVGNAKGVQMVGGMVFDPQRMCWLKMAPQAGRGRSDSGGMSVATEEDEDDPFAGLNDLEDGTDKQSVLGDGSRAKEGSLMDDEWLVGEEFDIGPEFKKRQRAEEGKWKKKMEVWTGQQAVRMDDTEWRWALHRWMEQC